MWMISPAPLPSQVRLDWLTVPSLQINLPWLQCEIPPLLPEQGCRPLAYDGVVKNKLEISNVMVSAVLFMDLFPLIFC